MTERIINTPTLVQKDDKEKKCWCFFSRKTTCDRLLFCSKRFWWVFTLKFHNSVTFFDVQPAKCNHVVFLIEIHSAVNAAVECIDNFDSCPQLLELTAGRFARVSTISYSFLRQYERKKSKFYTFRWILLFSLRDMKQKIKEVNGRSK